MTGRPPARARSGRLRRYPRIGPAGIPQGSKIRQFCRGITEMRIYMANVGANSNHKGLFSPLFEDGTFEFVPIWEEDMALDESPHAVHYQDLRSHYHPDQDLLPYVPKGLWGAACHNDPEFKTFTYGDVGSNPRSSRLTGMRTGDTLLFLVLQPQIESEAAFVMAEAGSGLMAPPPSGPLQYRFRRGSWLPDQAVQQPAHLGNRQRYQGFIPF